MSRKLRTPTSRTRTRSVPGALIVAIAGQAAPTSQASDQRYAVVDLGTLGGTVSPTKGINHHQGALVGQGIHDGQRHAFLLEPSAVAVMGRATDRKGDRPCASC